MSSSTSASSSTSTSLNIQMSSSILASTNNAPSGTSTPWPSISTLSNTSTLLNTQISSSILDSTSKDLSCTSAPSPVPLAHTASKSFFAIGLGIGLPFGLLLLLNVGFILYRERQRRTKMESLMRQRKPSIADRYELP